MPIKGLVLPVFPAVSGEGSGGGGARTERGGAAAATLSHGGCAVGAQVGDPRRRGKGAERAGDVHVDLGQASGGGMD